MPLSPRFDRPRAIPLHIWCVPCASLAIFLGFPNSLDSFFRFGAIIFVWPVCLALIGLRARNMASAFLLSWLACAPGYCAALYWLYLPLREVGQLPAIQSAICAILLAALLALPPAAVGLAARFWRHSPPSVLPLLLGLAWYFQELASARILGVPWLAICGAVADCPLLVQGAGILGAYGLGALWVCAALLPIVPFFSPKGRIIWRWAGVLAGALICVSIIFYGHARLLSAPFDPSPEGQDTFAALLVEGNVNQAEKWAPAYQRGTVDLYIRLTEEGLARIESENGLLLIIWPETALPFFFEKNRALAGTVRSAARRFAAPLLFGAPGFEPPISGGEEKIFNRAFLMLPDGKISGSYDKQHLVPFGEYVPSWLDWNFLAPLLQGVGIYSEGRSSTPLRYENLALGMLICYEGIFPWLAQERVDAGANILVDISNDGWFGNSPAPVQHLYLTALRAIEQNRWILRGTNTGISAVIDSRGRIAARGAQFSAGSLYARSALIHERSVYNSLAPSLPYCMCLLLLCLGAPAFFRKKPLK